MRVRGAFAERVVTVVRRIPRGRVATYGQIAALCGSPRAARPVGWVLRYESTSVQAWKRARRHGVPTPWWRVINREGRLSIVHPVLTPAVQAALLQREGPRAQKTRGAYWVDLQQYLWHPQDRRREHQRAGVV